MLTLELLKKNEKLKGLDETLLKEIAELSENDENIVLAKKMKEHWERIDKDILELTGEERPHLTKSHDHFKQVFSKLGKDYATKVNEVKKLTGDIAKLNKQIADGDGDEALKIQVGKLEKELKDKETIVGKLRKQVTDSEETHKKELEKSQNEYKTFQTDSMFSKALEGVEFKEGIDKQMIEDAKIVAKQKTLQTGKLEFVETDGKKVGQFRGEDDIIITNDKNLSRPYTLSEIYIDNLAHVLKEGQQRRGGGTGDEGGAGGGGSVDMSGVKSRREAQERIHNHVVGLGHAKNTTEYNKMTKELYEEANLDKDLATA